MDEKQIIVSLGDEKAKQISEVIGSKSCNRILNLLAEKDLTVSEISVKLNMPMNTVDYNIKKLMQADLVEKAAHWWSVKGKRMSTYKVSNRKIIISPRKSIAKVFAWTIGLTGLTALTIREFFGMASDVVGPIASVAEKSGEVMSANAPQAVGALSDSAPIILEGAKSGAGFFSFLAGINPWTWFLIGAWFAVFLFFAVILINDTRHRL